MKYNKTVYLPFSGIQLLKIPIYNKGNAFNEEERKEFNLSGLLPNRIETINDQLDRSIDQLNLIEDDLHKHIFLRDLQDTNETLFYQLVSKNLTDILPLIYTPTVGKACQLFSSIYRQPRGLFLSYPNRDSLEDQIWNIPSKRVKVIVITDGERILGLGDLGTGGMGIPIGKLSIYSACGGISPAYTLPIYVDVGTNNQKLLSDPMYIGWRNPRITGERYYQYLDEIMSLLTKRWPNVLIQFEDFAQHSAPVILERFRKKYCCFNDDIQGTAAITLGTLIKACRKKGKKLSEQTIVFAGAGSAAVGISNLLAYQMTKEGIDLKQAYSQIYLVNSKGLLFEKSEKKSDFQKNYIKTNEEAKKISKSKIPSLFNVVSAVKPGILIGVSGQKNIFDSKLIAAILEKDKQPIIFPLSNPTSKSEALPEDIINWTNGNAIIATGSPFPPVKYKNKIYPISQCNNSYAFPGIGLGVVSTNPKRISNDMILQAAITISNLKNTKNPQALLPELEDVPKVSKQIAFNVIKQAIKENFILPISDEEITYRINRNFWIPKYRNYRRTSF